jgi:hypothetical protein
LRDEVATGACGSPVFAAAVASVPPAYASCAIEADVSPYAFVRTVISTERTDHVATVITDNGQRVTVISSLPFG